MTKSLLPIELNTVARKNPGRTVIAHISDLHFSSSTDKNGASWRALAADIAKQNADLILVTGDLIDSSIRDSLGRNAIDQAFENVREYLLNPLCKSAAIDPKNSIIVIPGNHDYRVKGLIWKTGQCDAFCRLFEVQFSHRLYSGLRLCIFVFDSNTNDKGVNFATGLVTEAQLVDFSVFVEDIRKRYPDLWNNSTKISLIHHHPMPISATEHRESLTDREEFLLLVNAGLFMTETVKAEIDLVLHGHKHYPSFSRASFPTHETREHTLAVVGAGSVGKGDGLPRSYNLISIADSGEITLDRRSCPNATYTSSRIIPIRSYEQARQIKWLGLAESIKAKVRADKYLRSESIATGSGDDLINETFENVTSFSDGAVAELVSIVRSQSGFMCERTYECADSDQVATWHWLEPQGAGPNRRGATTFDPPIQKTPRNITRKSIICNAFYFSRQDRLDATDSKSTSESATVSVSGAYKQFIHSIAFPKKCFPPVFQLRALDPSENRDFREEEFIHSGFTRFEESAIAHLSVSHPLPGYVYQITWELPDVEPEEIPVRAEDAGLAQELIERLLAVPKGPGSGDAAITGSLTQLRSRIEQSQIFRPSAGQDRLEITLFCYDPNRSGLVCVAALGDFNPNSRLWSWIIRPGRTLIGQAYRRREAVTFIHVPGVTSTDSIYYEPAPEREDHTAVFCLPMFYPVRRGRRICVVSVASRSNTTGLLKLQSDQAAKLALIEEVIVWYGTSLVSALGIPHLL